MTKGLLIGASVVAGVFVGFIACKIIEKKCPDLLETARKKTSKIAAEAKRAFAEGFEGAQAKIATA